MRRTSNTQGLTVVEIIIAASIIISVVVGASLAWQTYIRLSNTGTDSTVAVLMAEEAAEALQSLRDSSWNDNFLSVSLNTNYYLSWTGSQYQLTTTPIINNNLTRTIVFSAVTRDPTTRVISSSGNADLNTLSALISVYPTGNATNTLMQTQTLIHNIYAN